MRFVRAADPAWPRETSERLAAGDLAVRIPERGEDELRDARPLVQRDGGQPAESRSTSSPTLSQLQQRFVSDVSHELRTPLTTIRLAGDVIYDQREDFPPATARTAELLHTQIERFDRCCPTSSRSAATTPDRSQLEPEPTNLVRLAEDVVDEMQPARRAERLGAAARRARRLLRRRAWTRGASGASSATCSATRSSTARGRPIVVTVDSNESAVALAVRDYGSG